MKTYLSVGIGDMCFLDSILTKKEKESISEIYWACRFGYVIKELLESNPDYPNLTSHHTIDDETGKKYMAQLDPVAVPFWHFRPDFEKNFEVGLNLFGIKNEWNNQNLQIVDAAFLFTDENRPFQQSSILKYANIIEEDYILFHYPTSTRPRSDIAGISDSDVDFVNSLSKETGLPVKIISDCEVDLAIDRQELFINVPITEVRDLVASCSYYAGCDSFCAHLASNILPKENIFIKLSPNFTGWNTWLLRAFLPHSPEDVKQFYKSYIGRP
jgi:hypothetical protein